MPRFPRPDAVREPVVRDRRYLNVAPSNKALQRDGINELADRRQGCTPISRLIVRLNRQLKGSGQLLLPGLPGQGIPEDQSAYWLSTGEPLKASSQPTPVQINGGCVASAANSGFQGSRLREIRASGSTRRH